MISQYINLYFSKDLLVDIPIQICHRISTQPLVSRAQEVATIPQLQLMDDLLIYETNDLVSGFSIGELERDLQVIIDEGMNDDFKPELPEKPIAPLPPPRRSTRKAKAQPADPVEEKGVLGLGLGYLLEKISAFAPVPVEKDHSDVDVSLKEDISIEDYRYKDDLINDMDIPFLRGYNHNSTRKNEPKGIRKPKPLPIQPKAVPTLNFQSQQSYNHDFFDGTSFYIALRKSRGRN